MATSSALVISVPTNYNDISGYLAAIAGRTGLKSCSPCFFLTFRLLVEANRHQILPYVRQWSRFTNVSQKFVGPSPKTAIICIHTHLIWYFQHTHHPAGHHAGFAHILVYFGFSATTKDGHKCSLVPKTAKLCIINFPIYVSINFWVLCFYRAMLAQSAVMR